MLHVHFFTYIMPILKNVFVVQAFVLNCLFSIIFSLKYDLMKPAFCPPFLKTGILSANANLTGILSTGILAAHPLGFSLWVLTNALALPEVVRLVPQW